MRAADFRPAVEAFMLRHDMIGPGRHVVVGLSGGADSVALLLVLLEMGCKVTAAHCNFHLRGAEADRDEAFVRSLCAERGVDLRVADFATRQYAKAHGVSIEMAARELRYDFFHKLRAEIGASAVAVAHHRDDNVETVVMNLMRGTGIHGLTGMKPVAGNVIRPLLAVSRADILAYLEARGQSYVTDSSNLVADVVRNKVRLEILPLMAEVNPSVAEAIERTAANVAEAAKVFDNAVGDVAANLGETDGDYFYFPKDRIRSFASPQSLLHQLFSEYGFTPSQVRDMADCLDAEPGRVFRSGEWELAVDRSQLVLSPVVDKREPMVIEGEGTYQYYYRASRSRRFSVTSEPVGQGFDARRGSAVACLDADRVRFPLSVRTVEAGERFVPYGMSGSKLISDYLTDRKRHVLQKQRQLVVCDASGAVVWLVGERTDNRFRITETTTRALVIAVGPSEQH